MAYHICFYYRNTLTHYSRCPVAKKKSLNADQHDNYLYCTYTV